MATILPVGTRIFNGGDRANLPHHGTITQVTTDRWGTHYEVTPDGGCERDPYWVEAVAFSDRYLGHGGTRFVTEAAYKDWYAQRVAEMRRHLIQRGDA